MAGLIRLNNLKLLLRDEARKYTDGELNLQLMLAMETINNRRGYTPTADLPIEPKYEGLLLQLAIAAINKVGAEGQSAHSENGISRTYGNDGNYPTHLLDAIIPLVSIKKGR